MLLLQCELSFIHAILLFRKSFAEELALYSLKQNLSELGRFQIKTTHDARLLDLSFNRKILVYRYCTYTLRGIHFLIDYYLLPNDALETHYS